MEDFYRDFSNIGDQIFKSLHSSDDEYRNKNVVGIGADGTATHAMDKVCEDIIVRYVEEKDLPFNIMSEELGFLDRKYEETILTDPLDGTFNAENKIPFYSVSIATLTDNFNSLTRGYVKDLARGDVFYAEKGKGSSHNGQKIKVSPVPIHGYTISLGKCSDEMRRKLIDLPGRHRSLGCASLEMALVARGSVDMMAYVGKGSYIRNIDVAAGVVLVREAGGVVVDQSGSEFNMGLDVTVRTNIVAARNREVLEEIL
jgi:fructose-1,6-bisphosphatase/inositol monophosphatase family enzyme